MKLQRLGGYAAIAGVCVFVILRAFSILANKSFVGRLWDPVKAMAAYSAAPADFYVINLLYIVYCILGLIVFFALYARMQANAPHLTRIMLIAASAATAMDVAHSIILTTGIGMILPTQDVSACRALDAIAAGLHGMGGHTYGWAFLLIGCAILRTRAFSQVLGWLALLTGILWIPNFFLLTIGFKLITPIPWYLAGVCGIWIGIALLRQKQPQPASR